MTPMDLLIKVVTEEYQEDEKWRNSIPTTPKIHVDRKKALKGGEEANEVLNDDDFPKRRASKKSITFMDSATSTAKTTSSTKKHVTTIENKISKALSSLKEYDKLLKIKRRSRSKRILIDDEEEKVDDVADQEWVPSMPLKKKQKKSKKGGGSTRHNPRAKKPSSSMVSIPTPPSSAPDLSQEFKNKIGEMGGSEITLIIQKSLYNSDLNKQQARLSMPLNKVKNKDFLRAGEVQVLEKKQAVQVLLIQPSLELTNVALAKWDMPKSSGVITSSYVLRSSWMKVARANQLKQDDVVQVWSFRVQDQLCMALVKV